MKILAAMLLLCAIAQAQDFWTTERKTATTIYTAEIGFDGTATQVLQSRGHYEMNPLSSPFTNRGPRGQAAYSVLSVVDFVLVDRLLSKHHPRAARILRWTIIVGQGANDARQAVILGRPKR
jgi:hypothetical protein